MKRYLKLAMVIIPMVLVLTGCKNIFIEYKRPDNQLGSKWLSSDKKIELVIRRDYDHDSYCYITADNGESSSYILCFFDMGAGLYLYDKEAADMDAFNDNNRYEQWKCQPVNRRKFVVTVEKTTFFEVGQKITFYRVDEK